MLDVIAEVIPPAVTRELAKSHLKVTHSGEDTLIDSYIDAATQFVEQYSGIRLIRREVQLRAVIWKSWYKLPRPLVELVSANDSRGTVPIEDLVYTSTTGQLWWPDQYLGPYELTVRAGVADDADRLPGMYRGPVLAALGHLYVNREGQEWPTGLQAQIRALGGVRL